MTRPPIAVVGIGCRFPGGVCSPDDYWQLLESRGDGIVDIPAERWNRDRHSAPTPIAGKSQVRRGGFLADPVDTFDPVFFGISPREADSMDPQQRLLLEVAYEAVEDAGVRLETLAGTDVGVFTGGFTLDYSQLQFGMADAEAPAVNVHTATGVVMTMLANRISHAFDLLGPSLVVDTACSSSLVAVHLACQSIWRGESVSAFAGGVNLMLAPSFTTAASTGGFLSPTSTSRAFDASANGYVRAEGAGFVFLKPLQQALADGDRVYATVRGTATSQDGRTNGITVPNPASQQRAMRRALAQAAVHPGEVAYVEAHGTGTPVGDPIEASAIGAVYGHSEGRTAPLAIGSVKSNVGHLEAAAGIAGLIKTALVLAHRRIPPHRVLDRVNPAIDLDGLRLRIPLDSEDLAPDGEVLAGVNSFGFGGTNAHVVLASAPEPDRRAPADQMPEAGLGFVPLLPFAARSNAAVATVADRLADAVEAGGPVAGLAAGMAHRRSHHRAERRVVVAGEHERAVMALRAAADGQTHPDLVTGPLAETTSGLAFVYTGMGPQWWGMGRELFEHSRPFRDAVERCDAAIRPIVGWSLVDEMLRDSSTSKMAETWLAQPANFAVQYGLTELLREVEVVPARVVGHSAGEVAAWLAAGSFSFDDAVTVIVHRARLQHLLAGQGRLLAAALTPDEAAELPEVAAGQVEVAAVNAPSSVVLVGAVEQLEAIGERLKADELFARLVPGDVPYHSTAMDLVEAELRQCLAHVAPTAPRLPMWSSVTGAQVPDDGSVLPDADYWWRNVRQPVRFAAAASAMIVDGARCFVEIGPSPVLAQAVRETAASCEAKVAVGSTLDRKRPDLEAVSSTVGWAWIHGAPVDWARLAPPAGHQAMDQLPRHPFARDRYWVEGDQARRYRLGTLDEPYAGYRLETAQPGWRRVLDGTAPAGLTDHVVHGQKLFPGAGFVEIALEVARAHYGAPRATLEDVRFTAPLGLHLPAVTLVEASLDETSSTVSISSRAPEAQRWVRNAVATLVPAPLPGTVVDAAVVGPVPAVLGAEELPADVLYEQFAEAGFAYGPAFRRIERVWLAEQEAVAHIAAPEPSDASQGEAPVVDPATLDAAFQLLLPLAGVLDGGPPVIPVAVERVAVHGSPTGPLRAHASNPRSVGDGMLAGDVVLTTPTGEVLVEVEGFTVRQLADTAPRLGTQWVYQQTWVDEPLAPDVATRDIEGRWLLLGGRQLADPVADKLRSRGVTPVLEPLDEDLAQVLDRFLADGPMRGVVHLGSYDPERPALQRPEEPRQGLDWPPPGLEWPLHGAPRSVVTLATELDRRGVAATTVIVTAGAQSVDGLIDEAGLAQSSMLGIGRVAHQELLGLESRLVDLDPEVLAADPDGSSGALSDELDRLVDEIVLDDPNEDQVAFRGGRRLLARLEPASRDGGTIPVRLRSDASYLVTGGLGALGRLVTTWLAEQGAGHLVLVGRSGLPDRSAWDALPAHDRNKPAVDAVRLAEARGARVHVVALDITRADAVTAALDELTAAGVPPLRGVIHAAGVVDDQILIRLDDERLERVLAPKITGAWALHTATAHLPLDFFALFSSISAVLPTPGQGNYAAGNAFLDALAHYRRGLGLPAVSINWGPWDTGMIAELGLRELFQQRGIDLIDPTTGMRLLAELLGGAVAQHGVVSAHWPTVIDQYPREPRFIAHLGLEVLDGAGAVSARERIEQASAEERPAVVADVVAEIAGRVLRLAVEKIDRTEPLGRLGLDSMIASELRIRLEQAVGVAPSIVFLLDGASVADIAAWTLANMDQQELDELLGSLSEEDLAQLREEAESAAPEATNDG
ncbi:MAG: type I polyketide synthase [Micrococcales bacterium]|nr:type I polyketide synthase [Micrococcales bacterium]MCL2668761.1 type I polyketide synthase [Micrococcales bacterium]